MTLNKAPLRHPAEGKEKPEPIGPAEAALDYASASAAEAMYIMVSMLKMNACRQPENRSK